MDDNSVHISEDTSRQSSIFFFQTHGSASTYSHGQKSAAGVYSQIKAKIMAGQKSAASSESKVILPGSNSYSNIKMGHH